jgi:hypothetical protein
MLEVANCDCRERDLFMIIESRGRGGGELAVAEWFGERILFNPVRN